MFDGDPARLRRVAGTVGRSVCRVATLAFLERMSVPHPLSPRRITATLLLLTALLLAGLSVDAAASSIAMRGIAPPVDSDLDGIPDETDNCDTLASPDQTDTDADGEGDVCDLDDDNDARLDTADACPTVAAPTADGCPQPAGEDRDDRDADEDEDEDEQPAAETPTVLAPPGTQVAPPAPRSRTLVLRQGGTVAPSPAGIVRVPGLVVACGLGPCSVFERFLELPATARASNHRGTRHRVLGQDRDTLAAGQMTAVRVRLTKTAKRRLKKDGRLRMEAFVTVTDAAGRQASVRQTFIVRARRR